MAGQDKFKFTPGHIAGVVLLIGLVAVVVLAILSSTNSSNSSGNMSGSVQRDTEGMSGSVQKLFSSGSA